MGKDKGKTGKVEKVFPDKQRVLVSGVNQYKRHLKARSQKQPSEIVTITKPLAVANVMRICPKCHLGSRIFYQTIEEKKERMCQKCQKAI